MATLAELYASPNPSQALTIGMDPALADLQARRALALQLMSSGRSAPTMSPYAAASEALSPLIGALAMKRVNKQYEDMATGAGPDISAIAHSADPVSVAAASKNPLVRAMLPQLASQQMQKRMQLNQIMAEKYGATLNDDGSVRPIPGVSGAASNLEGAVAFARSQGEKGASLIWDPAIEAAKNPALIARAGGTRTAENASDLIYKPDIAGATAQAENTPLINRAISIKAGEMPIEVEQAIRTAYGTAGLDIIKKVAGEGMIPRVATPTERMVSPFGALPKDMQDLTLQLIQKAGLDPNKILNPSTTQPAPLTAAPATAIPSPQTPVQPQTSAPVLSPTKSSAASMLIPSSSILTTVPQKPPMPVTPSVPVPSAAPVPPAIPVVPKPPVEAGTIPAQMSPQRYAAEEGLGKDFSADDKKQYDSANKGLISLGLMNSSADKLAQTGGWATMGPGNDLRADIARNVSSWEQTFGFKPSFDMSTQGSWENLAKETKRMGFELSRQLGSREAQQVIQQATSAVPHSENSYFGYRLVSSSVEQGLQRQTDLYKYKANILSNGGSLVDAEAEFNKLHPPAEYTLRALANAPPDLAVNILKDPTQYIQQAGGKLNASDLAILQDPAKRAAEFDRTYGPGMSQFILNGGRTGIGTAGGAPPGSPPTMPGTQLGAPQ